MTPFSSSSLPINGNTDLWGRDLEQRDDDFPLIFPEVNLIFILQVVIVGTPVKALLVSWQRWVLGAGHPPHSPRCVLPLLWYLPLNKLVPRYEPS